MEKKEKILMFWSGGKSCALALHDLMQNPAYEVTGRVAVLERETNRVRFHGIPDSLILEQAKLLKLPLQRIFLPINASNAEYNEQVERVLSLYSKRGIRLVAFGDITHIEGRKIKEKMLADINMVGIFPLWNQNTKDVAYRFFQTGHKALVTSVIADKLGYNFLACEYNEDYVMRLPVNVDPAGENGEFHTFVTFGPTFKMRVPFSKSIAVEEGPYLVSLIKEP